MSNFKLTKIICVSLISLQSITAFSFEMTDPELRQSIRRYLSIYDNVDENTVDRFVELVNRHSDLFNHLAEIETDPEFLPYVEKYSDLKIKFTGQPINADIKVVFSNNPLRPSNYNESAAYAGTCDWLTRVVFMDRGFWNHYQDNEKMKEAVLFHEMGHCDLNKIHRWEGDFSLMSAGIIGFLLFPHLPTLTDLGYEDYFQEDRASYEKTRNLYIDARNNLDATFADMYQELFSVKNTRDKPPCTISTNMDDENTTPEECMTLDEDILQFENNIFHAYGFTIPILKHITIGPRLPGNNLQEIVIEDKCKQQINLNSYGYERRLEECIVNTIQGNTDSY